MQQWSDLIVLQSREHLFEMPGHTTAHAIKGQLPQLQCAHIDRNNRATNDTRAAVSARLWLRCDW